MADDWAVATESPSQGLSPSTRVIVREMASRPIPGTEPPKTDWSVATEAPSAPDHSQFSAGRFAGQFGLSAGKKIASPDLVASGVGASHPEWNEYQWGVAGQIPAAVGKPDEQLGGLSKFWAKITGQPTSVRYDYTPRNQDEQQQFERVQATLNSNPSIPEKIAGAVNQFKSNMEEDPSKTSAETLASLLMLRQAFRTGKLPVFGAKATESVASTAGEASSAVESTPLKAKTPEAAQTEILKRIGVAGPKATAKPLTQMPPVTLKPSPDLAFATAKSGEDAAMQQLMRYSINELRGIAMQRGIKVAAKDTQSQLVNKIGDNLTDAEVEAFDQARVERIQPRYGLGPEKLGPKPKQYMTEGSDLLKALSQMAGK